MDIHELGSIGDLVAAAATIATLGYLAYQIRQNTNHSRAYTQRDLLTDIVADHDRSSTLSTLTRQGLSSFEELSKDDKHKFAGLLMTMTARFEGTFRLHNSGLVDAHLFEAHRAWILSWITTQGGNQWWETVRHIYSADVRAYLDNAIENKDNLPLPVTESIPFYLFDEGD